MNDTTNETVVICCSVFRHELDALVRAHWPDLKVRYIDSMMHMNPHHLAGLLLASVDEEIACGHSVVIVYGDCCAEMESIERRPNVARITGNNCVQILLGTEEYRRLSREGAFFLLPEWTHRWKEIFKQHLGLKEDNSLPMMQDMHSKLIYLDTGIIPIPEDAIRECAEFCRLPWEIQSVSLEVFYSNIQDTFHRLDNFQAKS